MKKMTKKEELTRLLAEAVMYHNYNPKPAEYNILIKSKYSHVLSGENRPTYLTESVFDDTFTEDKSTKSKNRGKTYFVNVYDKNFMRSLTKDIEEHFGLGVDSPSGWSNISLHELKEYILHYIDNGNEVTFCKDTEKFLRDLVKNTDDLRKFIWDLYWHAR